MSESQQGTSQNPEQNTQISQVEKQVEEEKFVRPSDEEILAFEANLRDTEASKNPLVSLPDPLDKLYEEYAQGSSAFKRKITQLTQNYDRIRRCRGDGNCFFRAFAFSWYEAILLSRDASLLDRAIVLMQSTSQLLKSAGFDALAYEDFYDTALNVLNNIASHDSETLLATFQSDEVSNSIVMHLRFITSAYLRLNAILYEPFLDFGISMDQFCQMHVESMGRESDEIHIIALCNALRTPVDVVYLDGHDGEVNFHEFTPDSNDALGLPSLKLLYRPGHYDILYRKAT
ncbi:uncharacterized protein VTP21DRAFT_5823 [Calcarisporiella thermophila]|uniref:uncharacterized protein n=1 Tax=Calcarisporiella thermophila TaxID=911321 RepID=UPI003743F906